MHPFPTIASKLWTGASLCRRDLRTGGCDGMDNNGCRLSPDPSRRTSETSLIDGRGPLGCDILGFSRIRTRREPRCPPRNRGLPAAAPVAQRIERRFPKAHKCDRFRRHETAAVGLARDFLLLMSSGVCPCRRKSSGILGWILGSAPLVVVVRHRVGCRTAVGGLASKPVRGVRNEELNGIRSTVMSRGPRTDPLSGASGLGTPLGGPQP